MNMISQIGIGLIIAAVATIVSTQVPDQMSFGILFLTGSIALIYALYSFASIDRFLIRYDTTRAQVSREIKSWRKQLVIEYIFVLAGFVMVASGTYIIIQYVVLFLLITYNIICLMAANRANYLDEQYCRSPFE